MKQIFGSRDFLPETVDLAGPPDGLVIYRIIGADGAETGIGGDMAAYSISAGDVDGDGFIDLAINGMGGDGLGNSREDAGAFIAGELVGPEIDSLSLKAKGKGFNKVRKGAPPPGERLIVKVINPNNVASNEVMAISP